MVKMIDIEKIKPIDFPSTEMDGLDVVRYLNTLPTVDAVEVVHGRWVTGIVHYVCSVCGNGHLGMPQTKYCPDCGAKMDGDGNG